MNKGILFSMDAVLALIVVILFAAWLPHYFSVAGENAPFEALHDQARDRAIVGLYTGGPGDNPGSVLGAAEFGECATAYTLDPNNALGVQAMPEPTSFCEAVG